MKHFNMLSWLPRSILRWVKSKKHVMYHKNKQTPLIVGNITIGLSGFYLNDPLQWKYGRRKRISKEELQKIDR